jgi:hypothetical protein
MKAAAAEAGDGGVHDLTPPAVSQFGIGKPGHALRPQQKRPLRACAATHIKRMFVL